MRWRWRGESTLMLVVLAISMQQSGVHGQQVTCETTKGDFTIDLHR